jgi:hypothetical protein
MQQGVHFGFNLDGATASLPSVLVYDAPLSNSLCVLRVSPTSASVSKSSVVVYGPPSTTQNSEAYSNARNSIPKTSKAYSNNRPPVDDKDILVWHCRLGHRSLAAIKRLPYAARGIQLHAKSPSTCTCEAYIMGKMLRKLFQPSEDKAKTRMLDLIHCNMIGPIQTQTVQAYRYIILFTDDYSRYTEVYFIQAQSVEPAKFKVYVAKEEKQHPKSKVCRTRVDGGGVYASLEKFVEYLAEDGIIREVSARHS